MMETNAKRQVSLISSATAATLLANLPLYHALSAAPTFPHARRLTASEFRQQYPTGALDDVPLVITDALSVKECEGLCDQWIQTVGEEIITVQRKQHGSTQLYDCTVAQSLDLMMQSKPDDSIFAFVEGLLEEHSTINNRLIAAREQLFADDNHHDINWFDFFPESAKPTDCVIVAGEGASSTLHRDPFEWTGTSLCLEGRKVWRFLPPPESEWDQLLQCYRLNSTAWDDDDNNEEEAVILSAGWQSDLSLYHREGKLLSARQLAEMPEEQAELYLKELASNNANQLTPPEGLWNDMQGGCSVVQHPGELVVIPPYWYHQTYAPEPSLAVASQRCGSRLDATRVIRHMLSLQRSLPTLPNAIQQLLEGDGLSIKEDPETMVKSLFDQLRK